MTSTGSWRAETEDEADLIFVHIADNGLNSVERADGEAVEYLNFDWDWLSTAPREEVYDEVAHLVSNLWPIRHRPNVRSVLKELLGYQKFAQRKQL